ncbi:Sucrase/ferredoxin-like-domain-containing protein [Naematelia encephala]|uniref:Sucrase/ferredoxin-like-domain-containing protein n=1 Tax=Naematelia encephala TaxID=71784 RepID=A0A1Y2B3Q6_9TREE|nr:Sucrase/ferredoxin-like-domain-containing protein [Naematelia encephala]
MLRTLSSAIIPRSSKAQKPAAEHHESLRAQTYVELAKELSEHGVPVDYSDCATCDHPCPEPSEGGAGTISEAGIWGGKKYSEYVEEEYGDLGSYPKGFDTDWDTELAGSGKPVLGRLLVVSTGKSDWPHSHTDDKSELPYQLEKFFETLPSGNGRGDKGPKLGPNDKKPVESYIAPSPFSNNDDVGVPAGHLPLPSMYSSSLISQSDDPEDKSVIVFPDWKVVNEVENSLKGAKGLWNGALADSLGRSGATVLQDDVAARRRSWVLPYRAVVLLCSHKRRDKRCHIAAPLLRHALIQCLAKHEIAIDETGSSLSHLDGPPLEEIKGTSAERDAEVKRRIQGIEGVKGGNGGEVGIFNINHLGGHRYAGVMLIIFPSGAYLSYGRVTPQEIPRVVEETILHGRVVPGLLRAGTGLQRSTGCENGFLGW